ncbi:histidine phosphatase family protein [Microtetraspora glauca]|uniref:Histidine phosphatase family protein n=1 Tax=Microtetraspora glauca TaxID=1996 RepID=A0ABV3GPB4_MICGL
MRRLILLRHASTPGMRAACFPSAQDADHAALAKVRHVAGLPARFDHYSGPEPAARQTAEAIRPAPIVVAALAEADHGRWSGLPYERVAVEEPEALLQWQRDPDAAPHGGESPAALAARVAYWLAGQSELDGAAVACCDAGPIRAALCHALGLPAGSGALFDLAPLSVTELSATRAGWRVGCVNRPVLSGRS